MTAHDRDKVIALLKSVAAPCELRFMSTEHNWRKCRHCLAIAECEHYDVRALIKAFIDDVEEILASEDLV